jgi:hypothetical protein
LAPIFWAKIFLTYKTPFRHTQPTYKQVLINQSGIDNAILGSYDAPPPFLCSLRYFCASEELEGHLAKQSVDGISDHFGKPGLVVVGVDEPDEESLVNLSEMKRISSLKRRQK